MKRHIKTNRPRFTPLSIFMLIVLSTYTFIIFGLLIWAMISSTRFYRSFDNNPLGFSSFFYKNFEYVFKATIQTYTTSGLEAGNANIGQMYLYSLLYAGGCALTNTIVPCITAYFAARYKYKYSKIIYFTVVIVMMVPIVGSLPSEIEMARTLHLYNEIWGLWIMKANFLGMYFLVFYEFFYSMPDAYVEAAKIDGAGNITVLTKIALPMVRNLFLTVTLINFVTFWNDYQTPLAYLKQYPTISYGVYFLTTSSAVQEMQRTPARLAATVVMFVPILILFLCTHKRLMGNLTVGGIKG